MKFHTFLPISLLFVATDAFSTTNTQSPAFRLPQRPGVLSKWTQHPSHTVTQYEHSSLAASSLTDAGPSAAPQFETAPRRLRSFAGAIKREAKLTWGVMQSDVLSTVMLGMSCTAAFCFAQSTSLGLARVVTTMIKSFVWFCFYGYHFDIANQLVGVEEDALNKDIPTKANRPLASGALSIQGGKVRYGVSGALYLVASLLLGGKSLTLQAAWWMCSVYLYNFSGWGNHFATKNYYGMTAGSAAMLLAARALSGDIASSIVPPILAASYIGMIMDIQDFRDEAGDRASGRKTTAVLLGVTKARKVWGAQFLAMTALGAHLVKKGLSIWPDSFIGVGGLALLISTLKGKTVQDDNKSYKNLVLYGFLVYFRSAFWAQSF